MTVSDQKSFTHVDVNSWFRSEARLYLTHNPNSLTQFEGKDRDLWACLTLKDKPFSDVVPRAVLVGDSHPVAQFKNNDSYLILNEKLQSVLPTLFMAQTRLALDRGALPGENTLFSPIFPSLHRKTIASSKLVVSFHLEPVLVALANRVPAIFLSGRKSDETEFAAQMGVPVLMGQDPLKMVAEIEIYFTHYPWKRVDELCQHVKKELRNEEARLSSEIQSPNSSVFTVCSISDSNYLPFFLGFLENINWASSGHFKCYLLALDANVKHQVQKLKLENKIKVLSLKDLWSAEEIKRIENRSPGNQAFSTKPRLLRRALQETGLPVFYCDSDVYFCQPSSQLQKTLNPETDSIVLFPHFNDEFSPAQLDGLFNAGMLAVGPGSEKFLHWWSEICYRECSVDVNRGLVGDQGYLNLVPILFERVKIYKGRNHNVARWNSKTLQLDFSQQNPEVPIVEKNNLVGTYHAAFSDDRGVYQIKYCWDQLVSFFSPAYSRFSSKALRSNLLYQQKIYWTHLDYFLKLETLKSKKWARSLKLFSGVGSSFWFTQKGRRWMKWAVVARRVLGSLQKQIPSPSKKAPVVSTDSNAVHWVESNQKALEMDSVSTGHSQKVA